MEETKSKCPKCRCWRNNEDFIKKDKVLKTCEKCRQNNMKNKEKNKCEHKQIRSRCIECSGASICLHLTLIYFDFSELPIESSPCTSNTDTLCKGVPGFIIYRKNFLTNSGASSNIEISKLIGFSLVCFNNLFHISLALIVSECLTYANVIKTMIRTKIIK